MGNLYILVDSHFIDKYWDESGDVFVEGRKGKPYIIRYENPSHEREKIVVSVDGLNVMTGDATWDRAYVVEPYSKIDILGWRQNSGEVASFEFSSVRGSYNNHNESGDIKNIGVIGCKVYKEKKVLKFPEYKNEIHHHWPQYPYYTNYPMYSTGGQYPYYTNLIYYTLADSSMRSIQATPTANASLNNSTMHSMRSANFVAQDTETVADVASQSLGTGWGQTVEFKTETVHYDFENNPCQTIVIYYDERRGLERRGINLNQRIDGPRHKPKPNAFPDGCPSPGRAKI